MIQSEYLITVLLRLMRVHRFGLAGAVFTKDEAQLNRVATQLECGITWLNCSQPCFPQLPWGGVKQSGIGCV
jgi:betaine-aldehyde dehydrogenase